MPQACSSFLELQTLSKQKIESVFSLAKKIKLQNSLSVASSTETIALLFFEASTRTRMSFETAIHRIGLKPILLDAGHSSSLEKGESVEDSVLNVAAMLPKILIIRCADTLDLNFISKKISIPIVNAGWGQRGHPSQALLDLFTLQENFSELNEKKILFVGDVRHSRVAASHFELASKFDLQYGVCSIKEFLPESTTCKKFSNLHEGLSWADAVIALRCQFERHGQFALSKAEYTKNFRIEAQHLKFLNSQAIIMHPGPINHGIEISSEVLQDQRCRVLQQVTNGVFIREAILRNLMLGLFDEV